MDEEFKVKFTIDMGDAEKKVASFKEDLKSTEKMKLTPKIGDIGRDMNKVFGNLRRESDKVQKNMFWSKEKKIEFHNFFKDLENKAYSSLDGIEKKYANLSKQLSVIESKRSVLKSTISEKDVEADTIREQLEAEMAKPDFVEGTWEELMQMKSEYDKLTSQINAFYKGASQAKAKGDMADYQVWLEDIEKLKAARDQIEQSMNEFKLGRTENPEGKDYEKIEKLRAKWEEVVKEAEVLNNELVKLETNPAYQNKTQQLQALGAEYKQIIQDVQSPISGNLQANDLQKMNSDAQNLNNGLRRSGRELKSNYTWTEKWQKMMARVKSRMMFSFVSLINPMNIIRKIWSGFNEQNKDVANTFKMISQNLIKVFEPAMRKISNWFFKIMQYVNVFTKSWFGVDLFDKSVLSSEKTKKNMEKMNQLTAGFDELNVFKDETKSDEDQTLLDTTGLPDVDTSKLTLWANNQGKVIGQALNWALEHPLASLGIALGAKFVGGLVGKGIGKLVGKGIGKLFGKGGTATAAAKGAASASGATTAGFWATGFGKATMGLSGTLLAGAGATLAGFTSYNMTKYWDNMSVGEKALNGVGNAAGIAAAGLGGYLIAGAAIGSAAGPVGAAIGVTVAALVGLTVSAVTARDGILSVKDAQEQYDSALEISAQAQLDYNGAVSDLSMTMSNLEQIERATGISGAALDEQVRSGALSVDQMTSSQLQVYNAYLQNQQAIENLKVASENLKLAHDNEVKSNLELQLSNAENSKSYDEFAQAVTDAMNNGEISTEEARTYFERAMADMSNETREAFMEKIPENIREGLDPTKYQSWGRSLVDTVSGWFGSMWKSAQETWQRITNLFGGKGFRTNAQVEADGSVSMNVASYDVGTNYVPNDQLAYIHKGEAIVPAKYNNSSYMNSSNPQMQQTIAAMNSEISALRTLISKGIPITGEFVQRGNDLYATVEKAKSKRGAQPISNAAFAR